MKILKEEVELHCSANKLWEILSDVGRCDWVPSIENITLSDDCRYFEMKGMGKITEKILKCDEQEMILQYSAIETPVPIEHILQQCKYFQSVNKSAHCHGSLRSHQMNSLQAFIKVCSPQSKGLKKLFRNALQNLWF